MKKGLLGQITKFGLVGVLCFFVDYFTYRLGNYFFETTGIAASFPPSSMYHRHLALPIR